jgi:hypothetical protein
VWSQPLFSMRDKPTEHPPNARPLSGRRAEAAVLITAVNVSA